MGIIPRWGVGPSILMYHSIADNSGDPYAVSVDNLRRQLSWIDEHGFEVISLARLLQLIQKRDHSGLRKKVVITFDDGCADFITNALPILLDHGATATVFLVTGMFGGRTKWNIHGSDVQIMTEDEARHIKIQGINLGSHTATHANLTLLDQNELQRQLKESHDALTHLGESFHTLSYPWGQWSPQIAATVKSSGYECALIVGEQTSFTTKNLYSLPRISMTQDMDVKQFQSLLTRTSLEKELRRIYRVLYETKLGAMIHNTLKNKTG